MKWSIPSLMVARSASGSVSSLLTGIDSYWKLDEASGNAIDSVAANVGTVFGTMVQNTAGKINTCYEFTSGDAYINIGALLSSSVFSISVWVFRPALGVFFQIFAGADSGTDYLAFVINTDNRIYLTKAGYGGLYQSTGTVPATTWTHLVVTYDAAGLAQFYIDGVLDDSGTDLQSLTWGTNLVGRDGGAFLDGKLDEIGIWNRVITPTEVTTLYNGGTGLSYPF